jgi:hypothetical protein
LKRLLAIFCKNKGIADHVIAILSLFLRIGNVKFLYYPYQQEVLMKSFIYTFAIFITAPKSILSAERTAGCTKIIYAIVKKVVVPAIASVPSVVPRSESLKTYPVYCA